jgi:ParB-like chromosome segregation protein Spo0J
MTDLSFMADRVERWPIDRLLPYATNARTHSEQQVAQLASSIVEFGFTVPCLVDERGVLIAGHGRLAAARKLGLTEVPVIRLAHLSDAQARALRLADNRLPENAAWDEELLAAELARLQEDSYNLELLGFDDGELDRLLADTENGGGGADAEGEDEVPEPPPVPVSQRGDLWVLGPHRLLCGDSTNATDVQRLMNGEKASLFATDPPYLVDYDGTNHPGADKTGTKNKDWGESYGVTWDDADQGPDLYRGFIRAAIDHAIEPNAAWYCWHASRRQAMLEAVWVELGAFVHQQIIWVKNRAVLTRSFYLWKHEPCLMGWLKGNKPERVSEEYLSSVWTIDTPSGEDRPDHPTPKPLECFSIPMLQHVGRGGLCYEPFSGSGSQIMAGQATGRRVFAMEISPQYVDVAVRRWQTATGEAAVLEEGGDAFDAVAAERQVPLAA